MKITSASAIAILATSAAVTAAPAKTESNTGLQARDMQEISQFLSELDSLVAKRELTDEEITKRESQLVTQVFSFIKDTNAAPLVLHFFATNPKIQPTVISTIILVLKSGLLNLTALFDALDESNLLANTIQDLISDCSLYVEIFNIAKKEIGNLASQITSKLLGGRSKRDLVPYPQAVDSTSSALERRDLSDIEKRDLNDLVVSTLESLSSSGLITSVIKSVITDPSYIPFATNLIKAVLQNKALDFGALINALKQSSLVPDLLKQILTINTLKTVATNAFAAFAGKCSTANTNPPSTKPPVVGGDTAAPGSNKGPCKRRRRRRSNY